MTALDEYQEGRHAAWDEYQYGQCIVLNENRKGGGMILGRNVQGRNLTLKIMLKRTEISWKMKELTIVGDDCSLMHMVWWVLDRMFLDRFIDLLKQGKNCIAATEAINNMHFQ